MFLFERYRFTANNAGWRKSCVSVGEQKHLYNSKELQLIEFSNSSGLEWYDYGARMMDPQSGRWHVLDPFSSKYPSLSPYNYALNNPIGIIDPDGMDVEDINGVNGENGWSFTGEDAIVGELKLVNSSKIRIVTVMVKQWAIKRAPAYVFFMTSNFDKLIGSIQTQSPGNIFDVRPV